jgi:hypothetical protein
MFHKVGAFARNFPAHYCGSETIHYCSSPGPVAHPQPGSHIRTGQGCETSKDVGLADIHFPLILVPGDPVYPSRHVRLHAMTAPRSARTGAAYGPSSAFSVVSPASTADPLEELKRIGRPEFADGGLRIAIKPNLTWIEPSPGVTTSREAIRLVASALISAGNEVVIVESNGGYGTFTADAAFHRHGLHELL